MAYSSTGEPTDSLSNRDSVNIAIDDLRKVNAKLIELKYEKEINSRLRDVVNQDSIVIVQYSKYATQMGEKAVRYKRQRNVAASCGIGAIILAILALLR